MIFPISDGQTFVTHGFKTIDCLQANGLKPNDVLTTPSLTKQFLHFQVRGNEFNFKTNF